MAGTRTLTIIKPDAFGAHKAGRILAHLEGQGFTLKAARVMHMTTEQAGKFYEVHAERGFFGELVEFMTSGPCMPMVLEKADAVAELRTAIVRKAPSGSCSPNRRGGTRFMRPTRMKMRPSKPHSSFLSSPESGRSGSPGPFATYSRK